MPETEQPEMVWSHGDARADHRITGLRCARPATASGADHPVHQGTLKTGESQSLLKLTPNIQIVRMGMASPSSGCAIRVSR